MRRIINLLFVLLCFSMISLGSEEVRSQSFDGSDFQQNLPVDPLDRAFNAFGPVGPENQYEQIYKGIWAQIGNMYYKPEQLSDWANWEHKFDGKLHSARELDLAIQEMVNSLNDQWTRYVTRDERIHLSQEQMAGHLRLGLQLKKSENGDFYIDYIEWGSPAHNSPLSRGDIVLSIGTHNLSGLSAREANELAKGDIDTTTAISYIADGKQEATELHVLPTPEQVVVSEMVQDGILYLRLPDFKSRERTAEFIGAIQSAGLKYGRPLKGIVLDLRGNGGGEFPESLVIASLFIEKGTIVTSRTRSGRVVSQQTYSAIPVPEFSMNDAARGERDFVDSLLNAPMVVLTDGNTASAAEIVTGALKDNRRATIVGETTYGKGVGYATSTGPTGGVITITGLEYLTPSGYNLAHKGIKPDIEVLQPRNASRDMQMQEAIRGLTSRAAQ